MRRFNRFLLGCFLGWWLALECRAAAEPGGFAIPQEGRRFEFPRDHGSHPEFSIEWWYITGHLDGTNGLHFGFQATFFRRAAGRAPVKPAGASRDGSPGFGRDHIFLAHMALVDVGTGRFLSQERLNREGWDAGASTETLDVRNGNWRLCLATNGAPDRMRLSGGIRAEASFELELFPLKPLVVFGTNGVSRKAAERSAASHYLTFPRLAASGTVRIGDAAVPVTGMAWMDHEFSSSQLGEGQVGWDWASIQLKDGRDVMAYRMRRRDGSTDPFSTLAWVDSAGRVTHVGADRFRMDTVSTWRSPVTGANYPSTVRVTAFNPGSGKEEVLVLQPLVADQELRGEIGGVDYWEGACRVLDDSGRELGRAYLELTGYSAELKGRF